MLRTESAAPSSEYPVLGSRAAPVNKFVLQFKVDEFVLPARHQTFEMKKEYVHVSAIHSPK